MTLEGPVREQLFHTYSTISRHEPDAAARVSEVSSGLLTLHPHAPVEIGSEPAWSEDPLDDANWRFQYHSLVWLDRYRDAAERLGDDAALAHYERLLASWIRTNPVGASANDYAWFDMSVGLRAVVLAFAVDRLGRQGWLIDALHVHGEFLASSAHYDSRGNHGLHQDLGLIVVAQLVERDDWLDLARERIQAMFSEAIDVEGVSREGCIDYQYRNLRWYGEARRRLAAAGVQGLDWMDQRLDRMPEFLAHATAPGGDYALIGDTLQHRAARIEGTAADWSRDRSKAPSDTVRLFDAGYIFARTAWSTADEDSSVAYVTQRFGPGRASAVHGHEDGGSITLDLGADSILRDSGLYAYEAGEPRLYTRGRQSHNVVDVPGRDFYTSAETELVAFQQRDDAVFSSVRSRSIKGVRWDRSMLWVPEAGIVLVDDRVRVDTVADVVQRWHLHEGTRLTVFSPAEFSGVLPSGARIDFWGTGASRLDVANGSTSPFDGWVSRSYRSLTPAPSLALGATGDSVRFTTLLAYGPPGSARPVLRRLERTSRSALVGLSRGPRSWAASLDSDGFVLNSA